MTPRTENLRLWVGNWFDDQGDPETYVEGCDTAPEWLADDTDDFRSFRDELAAHIRDSSHKPLAGNEPQWINDEWLRNLHYDLFGPEPPPGDAYPVAPERWGRARWTPYLLHNVGRSDETSGEGAPAWLRARGLTYADIDSAPDSEHFRPEPDGYQERLERLTREGARPAHPDEPWYDQHAT
ncbi:hypothetical protein CLV30_11340 [Haloactinopolyspora alba]|uniref:Uncharacterized protein n=1 Tax=Haloactinopolyspora alba TaxID=648780 RepID=A0A2P8DWH2_9ACTN|nr:hypothetical protein [Haloactinopolyspora alba]PSL01552.1 hypothetical protein CLV30_11340 [Haloactinopolyspora alba]